MASSSGERRRFRALEQQLNGLGQQIAVIDACEPPLNNNVATAIAADNVERARDLVHSLRQELRFIEAQVSALCERNRELENQIGVLYTELKAKSYAL